MNALHLVWMLPLAALFGFLLGCLIDGIDQGGDSDGLDNDSDIDR